MASSSQPKQVTRAKSWDEQVEEGKNTVANLTNHVDVTAYRFQLAGYRDQCEYLSVQRGENVSSHTSIEQFMIVLYYRLKDGHTMGTSRNYAERMAVSIIITNKESARTEKCTRQNCMCTRLTCLIVVK